MAGSDELITPTASSGWNLSARLVCFAVLGAGTGAISGWIFLESSQGNFWSHSGMYLPGMIYGLLWLAAAWCGTAMVAREKCRRSWMWTLGFLLGVTLSFTAAYQSANHAVFYLSRPKLDNFTDENLMLSGFLGGIPGGLGLACMLGLLFRGFDSWATRSILTACSALLGAFLVLWPVGERLVYRGDGTETDESGIIVFFIIWQSGMAIAIVAMDAAWRRRESAGEPREAA